VYSAVMWKSVQLFEYDSRRLLKEGRMCRCIGTMKRDGKEWVMRVLNVWEASSGWKALCVSRVSQGRARTCAGDLRAI
jgi:hypothetical protein